MKRVAESRAGWRGRLPAGLLPSEYPLLLALSGAGVFLGVVREGLLILFFGFSDTTDTIHLYLLVTYSLGLLTDPIRLAGLNLFQTLPRRDVMASAALVVVPFGILVAVTTATLAGRPMELPLLAGITATGVLMQLNQLTMAYKQRGGAVVPTQIVTLAPNLILIPGIVLVGLGGMRSPATGVLVCFFIVPIVQFFLLTLIEDEQPAIGGPTPSRLNRLRLFAKHSLTAVGKQGFEIVARTTVIALGEGFLTAFSLVTRIYASLKLVLVDTFIGARIKGWTTTETIVEVPRGLQLALHPLFLLGLTTAGLSVALASTATDTRLVFSLVYVGFLLVGFPYDAGARILYFRSNARMIPEALIVRIAFLEILFAAVAFGITRISIRHVPIALLAWYLVKSAAQCWMILRTLRPGARTG